MTDRARVHTLSAVELAGAIRRGELTAVQACEAYLDRIAELDPMLNCYTDVFAESARETALEADRALARERPVGPLHGVPVAVKDLFDIAGRTTLAASLLRVGDPVASEDALALSRVRSAGAVLIGTLNMDEFAAGFWTEHTHHGPTRNPWNPDHMAGGSSGGAGAAMAAGLAAATLGSDTNGSIRVPASFCGVVGFKPTYGRIPTAGITPLAWSLDHVGPITRTVGDARLLYQVMTGDLEPPGAGDPEPTAAGLAGLRLGVLPEARLSVCSPDVLSRFREIVESIAGDVEVAEVDTPALDWSRPAAGIITAVEAAAYHRADLQSRPLAFHRGVRSDLRAAALLPAAAYVQAQRVRGMVRAGFAALFEGIDALLVPTTPVTALRLGDPDGRDLVGHFTQPFSFAGVPALSVPIGQSSGGLPIGLTIVGPAFGDELTLRIGAALETRGVVRVGTPPVAAASEAARHRHE